jgi:hypothetical protein
MDRRQMLVQRVREFFGDRTDDVLHMVRQDRQELRGWQEPAHVRAVVRRSIRGAGRESESAEESTERTGLAEFEFARSAGEPEPGQQREATGQLLEAAANGLERIVRNDTLGLNNEELLGLECVLLLYGRPAVLIRQGSLGSVPPYWNLLEDQREDIELAARGVGRIELLGHPEFDWAGTGFLVNDNLLLTARRVAELFLENRGGSWQFRPGLTTWMNYRSDYQRVSSAGYRVRSVAGVHDRYDLALLEVERPQVNGTAPTPLALASEPPTSLDGRDVYLIGYPIRDARRNEPEAIARIFREVYNVKRVQPGRLRGGFRYQDVELLRHDCAPLGLNTGAPLLDLETQQVLGVQTSSRYLDISTAVPLYALRDDPLLRNAGVTFAEATFRERRTVVEQLERLSRSRYWNEAAGVIANLYERAFGSPMPSDPPTPRRRR